MPKHLDAVGYINDLAKEVGKDWFRMMCDIVAVTGASALDQPTIETLSALYCGRASYIASKPAPSVATAVATAPTDSIEQLSGFSNFKRLGDTLVLDFRKRITLVFGANGSGKSSLCESLKVLSTPEQPTRPLENVRAAGATTPTFQFKFKSDTGLQRWTSQAGYGLRKATVKYFDTAIAIQNVANAVEPGRVIVIAPFKLQVFEQVKSMTAQFREVLQQQQRDDATKLAQSLQAIRTDFARFKTRPLALIDEKTISCLPGQIELGKDFKDQKLLGEKRAAVAEIEKAITEEGLRLLRAEYRELESLLTALNSLLGSAIELWALEPATMVKVLLEKEAAQGVLAKQLIPEGGRLDGLLTLLRAAYPLCKMDQAAGHACPLCKRDLGAPEIELFRQYNALLVGVLEKEIARIRTDLTRAREIVAIIGRIDRKAWENCKTIPEDILKAAITGAELVVAGCDPTKEPATEARPALESLRALLGTWTTLLGAKKAAIDTATQGRDELAKRFATLRTELEPLEYSQAIAEGLAKLRDAQQDATTAQFWNTNLPAFTQVLRRITDAAKDAYEQLVVADFEVRLDAEYKALAEKDMAAFGVKLARKGADASVTVLPQIGGKRVEGVLSEGEQRLHALALFFAELETCPQSVVVFDDPISSFDYNYIENYCIRLRNHSLKHPKRQVIILTHNWEFFTQLQTTLKRAYATGTNEFSVMVLEGCTQVSEYCEQIDELKRKIDSILSISGEPTKGQKEDLAGNMRRLVEAVMNKHVFADSRQQYKQRTQAVSEFHRFTQLVPLLPGEALELKDLFGKLSKPEHDDDRNSYVNTDKAMFQTRYGRIIQIEGDIVSRK